MAEPDEDFVALILSALGTASASELSSLSESLASDSSLQLQRLWLLAASPSRCLSIISFLDSLAFPHRRLLLARVTLRLVSRITDFLQDPASVSSSHQGAPEAFETSPVHAGPERCEHEAENASFLLSPKPEENGAVKLPVRADDEGKRKYQNFEGIIAFADERHAEQPCSSENLLLMTTDLQNCCASLADSVQCHALGKESTSMDMADAAVFENTGVQLANDNSAHVDLEGLFPSYSSVVNPNIGPAVSFNSLARRNGTDVDKRNPQMQSSKMGIGRLESVGPQLATSKCLGAKFPNFIDSGADLSMSMGAMSGEDKVDDLSLPWGETDVAFLFLFLWETQEQECQEAAQWWCIDSFVYHLWIVQDMAILVDDDKKVGRRKAQRWRECLQQYLRQHVLQLGYGFPGVMASANMPASLSAYIDTIGRFQRILESMDVEDSSEQKLPATSAAVLHSLPTTVIGLSSEKKGKLCIICKEELEFGNVASWLPCMHIYHWDCICSWLKQRNSCPVCRFELPSDNYDHELERKKQFLRERILVGT